MEPMGKLKTCEPFYHSRDSAIGQCASGSRQVYTQQLEKSQVPRTLAGTFWRSCGREEINVEPLAS